MIIQAPTEVTESVQAFGRELGGQPVLVTVDPIWGAETLDCFTVVDQLVADRGGSRLLGWRMWENVGHWLEAEFHAVWRRPGGDLVDVTPAQIAIDRSLFVPDPAAVYHGRQVNNRFWRLSTHPAIGDYIAAQASWFELMNRGERSEQHGQVTLSPAEGRELEVIISRMQQALRRLDGAGA